MIDVIINETGGLTLAHDDKSLDGFDTLEVGLPDGTAILRGPTGNRPIGDLRPSMLEMVRKDMPGRMVRMAGWSLARITPLTIRIRA